MAANALVAKEFYPRQPGAPLADALAFNTYRLRHAAQNLGLHMREGARARHATLLAVAPPTAGGGAAAAGRRRGGSGGLSLPPLLGGGAGGAGGGSGGGGGCDPIGVCNVTLRWSSDSIAAAAGCLPGAPFAMVSRRRGETRRGARRGACVRRGRPQACRGPALPAIPQSSLHVAAPSAASPLPPAAAAASCACVCHPRPAPLRPQGHKHDGRGRLAPPRRRAPAAAVRLRHSDLAPRRPAPIYGAALLPGL
jgi:hypothetical protein